MDTAQRILSDPVFASLPTDEQDYILSIGTTLRLSLQYLRNLAEISADLSMWEEGPLKRVLHPLFSDESVLRRSGTARNARIMELLNRKMDVLRREEPDYSSFPPPREGPSRSIQFAAADPGTSLLGTCPVAGEKTRCCGLLTLDAVMQCGCACSYCSIQSFYDEQQIFFHSNLPQRLRELGSTLDPKKIYHIGTGQSSDSLMFGNRGGVLDALIEFAREHPQVILELKTKSGNISYLSQYQGDLPKNIICTWSVNPQQIIDAEEHLTASLEQRLTAARRAADRGLLTGFHFHPIIRYRGWQDGFGDLVSRITEMFDPQETALVSLGTLTFIKPVIRKLRTMGIRSKVLQIPLTEVSGKFSYPPDIKKELFTYVYGCFPDAWKQQVFFYLCMEPSDLWEPVLRRSYPDNSTFEAAMKDAYMEKILSI